MTPLGRRRAGMTLIEILVALSISVLVLFAAVTVYRTIIGSLQHQQNSRQAPAYCALDQLRQDLSQCAQVPATNHPAFLLESQTTGTNEPQISSLSFSIGSLPSPEADFSSLEVTQVRYNFFPNESGEEGILIRETMCLWGSNALAPAVSNSLLEHVTAFEVSALSSTGWTNNWASSNRGLLPRAARVRLDWRSESASDTACMEVFIPAGNLVPAVKPGP